MLIGEQPEELSSYSMAPEVGLLLTKADDNLQSVSFDYGCDPLMVCLDLRADIDIDKTEQSNQHYDYKINKQERQ